MFHPPPQLKLRSFARKRANFIHGPWYIFSKPFRSQKRVASEIRLATPRSFAPARKSSVQGIKNRPRVFLPRAVKFMKQAGNHPHTSHLTLNLCLRQVFFRRNPPPRFPEVGLTSLVEHHEQQIDRFFDQLGVLRQEDRQLRQFLVCCLFHINEHPLGTSP